LLDTLNHQPVCRNSGAFGLQISWSLRFASGNAASKGTSKHLSEHQARKTDERKGHNKNRSGGNMFGRPTNLFQMIWRTAGRAKYAGVVLVLLVLSLSASAQILYGSLTGTVADKAGALIPNAAITLTSQETGAIRTTTASETGMYAFLNILPGGYTVSVDKAGSFGGFAQKNIAIEPNRQVRIDIVLQPASVSTQVTVTDAPPALQTESAEVNSEISQEQLSQLPITSGGGRSFQALYTLIPGGTAVAEQNSTASNPSRAMSVNVNGADNQGNTTRIDGAVNY
jgi:hypothetical protein